MDPVWFRCLWFFPSAKIFLVDRIFLPNLHFAIGLSQYGKEAVQKRQPYFDQPPKG